MEVSKKKRVIGIVLLVLVLISGILVSCSNTGAGAEFSGGGTRTSGGETGNNKITELSFQDGIVTPAFFYQDTTVANAKSMVLTDTGAFKVGTSYKISYTSFTLSTDQNDEALTVAEARPTDGATEVSVEVEAESVDALIFSPLTTGITIAEIDNANPTPDTPLARYQELYVAVENDPAKKTLYYNLQITKVEELDATNAVVKEVGSYSGLDSVKGEVRFEKGLVREEADIRAMEYDLAGSYVLANDVDINLRENWASIGNLRAPVQVFTGTFDGAIPQDNGDANVVTKVTNMITQAITTLSSVIKNTDTTTIASYTITIKDDGNGPYEWNGLFNEIENPDTDKGISNLSIVVDTSLTTAEAGTAGILVQKLRKGVVTNVTVRSTEGNKYNIKTDSEDGIIGKNESIVAGDTTITNVNSNELVTNLISLGFDGELDSFLAAEASTTHLVLYLEDLTEGDTYTITYKSFLATKDSDFSTSNKIIEEATETTTADITAETIGEGEAARVGLKFNPIQTGATSLSIAEGDEVYLKLVVTKVTHTSPDPSEAKFTNDTGKALTIIVAEGVTSITDGATFKSKIEFNLAGSYKLATDVTVTLTSDWEGIGKDDSSTTEEEVFTGKLDGDSHTLTIADDSPANPYKWNGLFDTFKGATLSNITIEVSTDLYARSTEKGGLLIKSYDGGDFNAVTVSRSNSAKYKVREGVSAIDEGLIGEALQAPIPVVDTIDGGLLNVFDVALQPDDGELRDIFFYETTDAATLTDSEKEERNLFIPSELFSDGSSYNLSIKELVIATDDSYTTKVKEITKTETDANPIELTNLVAAQPILTSDVGLYVNPFSTNETAATLAQAYRDLNDGDKVYFKATVSVTAQGVGPGAVDTEVLDEEIVEGEATRDLSIANYLQLLDMNYDLSEEYSLKNDIDIVLTDTETWTPFASYTGTLDGKNNSITVSSTSSSTSEWNGLFATFNGTLKDITLTHTSDLTTKRTGSGGFLFVSFDGGTLSNVSVVSENNAIYKVNNTSEDGIVGTIVNGTVSVDSTNFTTSIPSIALVGHLDDLLNNTLKSPNLALYHIDLVDGNSYTISYNSILVTESSDYSNTNKIIEETTAGVTSNIIAETIGTGATAKIGLKFNPIQTGETSLNMVEGSDVYVKFEITKITNTTTSTDIYESTKEFRLGITTGVMTLTGEDLTNLSLKERLNFNLAGSYKLATDVTVTLTSDWEGIGKDDSSTTEEEVFTGKLDGDSHTLTIADDSPANPYKWNGLFDTFKGATLSNITIEVSTDLYARSTEKGGLLIKSYDGGDFNAVTVSRSNSAKYKVREGVSAIDEGLIGEALQAPIPVVDTIDGGLLNVFDVALQPDDGELRDIFFYETTDAATLTDSEKEERNLFIPSELFSDGSSYNLSIKELVIATDDSYTTKVKEITKTETDANPIELTNLVAAQPILTSDVGLYVNPFSTNETAATLAQAYRDLNDGDKVYFKATVSVTAQGVGPGAVDTEVLDEEIVEGEATRDLSIANYLQLLDMNYDLSEEYSLKNDIDIVLTDTETWTPFASYTGTLDGKNNSITVSSTSSSTSEWNGLFATFNGTLKDITLTHTSDLTTKRTGSGGFLFVSFDGGTLSNVSVVSENNAIYKVNNTSEDGIVGTIVNGTVSVDSTNFTTSIPSIALVGHLDDLLNNTLKSPNLALYHIDLVDGNSYTISYNSILVTESSDYSNTNKIIEETTAGVTSNIIAETIGTGATAKIGLKFNPIQTGETSLNMVEGSDVYVKFEITKITNTTTSTDIYESTKEFRLGITTGVMTLTGEDLTNLSLKERLHFNLAGSYKLADDVTDADIAIVLTGNWSDLGDFTGTLNGNNRTIHISHSNSTPYKWLGFFDTIDSNDPDSIAVQNLNFNLQNTLKGDAYQSGILARTLRKGTIKNVTITHNNSSGIRDDSINYNPYGAGTQGGLIGRINHTGKVLIENVSVDLRFETGSTGYGKIGGIIGEIDSTGASIDPLHTITLSGLEFNGSIELSKLTTITNVGGFVGEVDATSQSNTQISGKIASTETVLITGGENTGGVVGSMTNASLTVDSVGNITVEGGGNNTASVVGYSNNSNITVKTLGENSVVTVDGDYRTGGVFGYADANSVLTVESLGNLTVTGAIIQTGGVVGYLRSSTVTAKVGDLGPVTVNGKENTGGLVGLAEESSTISSSGIGNITVKGTDQRVGGAVGNLNSSTITEAVLGNTGAVTVEGPTNVGGLVGSAISSSTISSSSIGDITVQGTDNNVGGAVGSMTNASLTIDSIGDVTVNGSIDNVGGAVGDMTDSSLTVDSVGNLSAKGGDDNTASVVGYSNNSTITVNSIGENSVVTVEGDYRTGGVVGYADANSVVTVESLGNLTVTGTNAQTGGVVGYIKSSNVTAKVGDLGPVTVNGFLNTGGLVGLAESSSTISSSGIGNITVKGTDQRVGGAVGYLNSSTIVTAKVGNLGNVYVKGNQDVGGAVGYVTNASSVTAHVDDSAGGGVVKIVGNLNVGGMVGYSLGTSSGAPTIRGYVKFKNALNNFTDAQLTALESPDTSEIDENDLGGVVYGDTATGDKHIGGVVGKVQAYAQKVYAWSEVLIQAGVSQVSGGLVGRSDGGTIEIVGYTSGTIVGATSAGYLSGFLGYIDYVSKLSGYVKNMKVVNKGVSTTAANELAFVSSRSPGGTTTNVFVLSPSKVVGSNGESTAQILSGSNTVSTGVAKYYDVTPSYAETNANTLQINSTDVYSNIKIGTNVGEWVLKTGAPPILAGGEDIFGMQ